MKKFYIMFGFLSLAAFSKVDEAIDQVEQLLGVSVDESGITFQVRSNGCTHKTDFQFLVEERLEPIGPMLPAVEHHHYITAKRLTQDRCEELVPYGTKIFMSFDELAIQFGKFHVSNPIGGDKLSF